LAVQASLPLAFVLPLGNACFLLGVLANLRAVYQFCGQRLSWVFLLPVVIAIAGVYWFTAHSPNLGARVVIMSFALAILLFASTWRLQIFSRHEPSVSLTVLALIFLLVGMFSLFRAVYFLFVPSHEATLLDSASLLNTMAPLVLAVLPVIGTTAYLLMCSHRIRKRWELAASTDYLTGLVNRRTVALAGERAFHSAQRHGQALSVAVIDVDYFKSVNDRFGHDSGDLALKHIAAMLEMAGRKTDLLGRHGGEEFVVLLDQTDREQSVVVAERLRSGVEGGTLKLDGHSITLTVSIGLATFQETDRSFNDLLRRADKALYAAKAMGRNRVEIAEA
jgi:diguanylate cyclase (GGDEF)-like protein